MTFQLIDGRGYVTPLQTMPQLARHAATAYQQTGFYDARIITRGATGAPLTSRQAETLTRLVVQHLTAQESSA